MDRQIVYPGQIPLETDLLHAQKDALIGLAMACQAMLGTTTAVDGLACTATSPASLSVNLGPGSLYAVEPVDGSAYGSLPADTTDSIVKQGIQLAPTTLTLTPPGTVGYAINYLIEAAYLDQDGGSTVLPYYNASNPSQAYSGPNNSGAAQNTVRQGLISLQAKAGVAASAGSQITPAVDAGYTALYVVTVAYGATTLTAGNIAVAPGAPFIAPKLPLVPAAIQAQAGNYAPDTGTVNALAVTLTPAPSALTVGLPVRVKVATTNTAAATLNVNGLGAAAIAHADGSALVAGDLVAGQVVELIYNGSAWVPPAVPAIRAFSTVVSLTAPGAGAWVVPAAVFLIQIEGWGGGGGSSGSASGGPISGGGGGGYFAKTLVVAPGQSIPYVIGAGGLPAAYGATAAAGGTTTFNGTLSATGGLGSSFSSIGGGGVGLGGDLNLTGQCGAPYAGSTGGPGGSAARGSGGGGTGTGAASGGGTAPGGGAGGPGGGGAYSGQAGAAGALLIRY